MIGSRGRLGILMPTQFDQSAAAHVRAKEERVPQWSEQETRDFIAVRGEMERDFTVAKRNKMLWEVVASRMKERGYRRSPDQCKCKWKNLINRYKGKETSNPKNGKHCPFFDELHAVFTELANNMQRLVESEVGTLNHPKKRLKKSHRDKSSDEFFDNYEDEDGDSNDEQKLARSRRKKADKVLQQRVSDKSKAANASIHELLQDFYQQQRQTEAQWLDAMERRARERQMFEQDWQQSMERLERERLMLEQAWQEREEQRRIREENRAAKRDALLTTLLNKLIKEDS